MEVGMLSDYELACRLHKELNGVEVDQAVQAPGNLSVLSISDDDSEPDPQPDPADPWAHKRARSRSPLEVERKVAIVNQQAITVSIQSFLEAFSGSTNLLSNSNWFLHRFKRKRDPAMITTCRS
jgi:hypothetical protein